MKRGQAVGCCPLGGSSPADEECFAPLAAYLDEHRADSTSLMRIRRRTRLGGGNLVRDPWPVARDADAVLVGPLTIGAGTLLECADVRGCFSAGDGAGFDPATGVVTARLFTDAGNTTSVQYGRGLFTPAGGGG